ncbi:MAG TPA: YbhB/YbcL family Raf kinase inhibitor-like protein [Candidatus Paceibacterota bacterium]
MKGLFVVVFVIIVALAVFLLWRPNTAMSPIITKDIRTMLTLTSPTFQNNEMMPSKYTCDGSDILPPLEISGVPEDTKTLAVIVDDPDAPNGDWVHWIKWNIPVDTTTILEGEEPVGISGKGTSGNPSYMGPCPPSGTHHYHFKLYALDTILDLKSGSSKADLEKAMKEHIIEQTELIGLYSRTK